MKLPQHYPSLSLSERRDARQAYIKDQGGLCAYCKSDLNGAPRQDVASKRVLKRLFPPRFFEWPVHLHHCHKTGMTIGAVHAHCNAVLWQYEGE